MAGTTQRAEPRGSWLAVAVVPVLAVAAIFATTLHADPACATRFADGSVVAYDPPLQGQLPPGAVSTGCTSDVVRVDEAGAAVGLAAVALVFALWPRAPRVRATASAT